MRTGNLVKIHYATNNLPPDRKWRDRIGVLLVIGGRSGRSPRNVLIETDIGPVVVPFWNVMGPTPYQNRADDADSAAVASTTLH